MMFVDEKYLTTLGNNTESQREEIQRKHQSKVDDWSGGLRILGVRLYCK